MSVSRECTSRAMLRVRDPFGNNLRIGGDYWYSVVAVDPTASDANDSTGAYAVCWNPLDIPQDTSVQRTSRAEVGSVLTPRLLESAEAKTSG